MLFCGEGQGGGEVEDVIFVKINSLVFVRYHNEFYW
jgi:hypothetical protein